MFNFISWFSWEYVIHIQVPTEAQNVSSNEITVGVWDIKTAWVTDGTW